MLTITNVTFRIRECLRAKQDIHEDMCTYLETSLFDPRYHMLFSRDIVYQNGSHGLCKPRLN